MADPIFTKILVPVDLSEHSARALGDAVSLARRCGAFVVVLYVVPPAAEYLPLDEELWGASMDEHGLQQRVEQYAWKELETFLAQQPDEVRSHATAELKHGVPAEVILDTAKESNFDLIVVGTHGRRGVKRFLLGSVAERVIRYAHCPVLVVH